MRLSMPGVFLVASSLLTGCSASFAPQESSIGSAVTGGSIAGNVHGGRQPIAFAHVYLMEANTTNWAGPGIAADSSGTSTDNRSKSLLPSGYLDSIGHYVQTAKDGSFTLPNTYTCDTGAQVYLLSLGGEPDGANTNSSAGLMAVLGTCGTDFSSSTVVDMNEVSTIAAAYAMAGFATDATHVGAPSSTDSLAATGIKNAFANAKQMFGATSTNPFTSGNTSALATTPDGNGTVPQKKINTLANILAACVNTIDNGGTQCGTLFSGLKSGGSSGTQATETATEAIYMAHNPSVTSVYSITGSGAQPWLPWLDGSSGDNVPADFTIAITFTGGGINHPSGIAIDGSGNAWISNGGDGATELSPSGKALTSASGYSTASGNGIAIDAGSDTVWMTNNSNGLTKITVSGGLPASETALTPFGSPDRGAAVSVDGTGNVWVADNRLGSFAGQYILETNSSGASVAGSPFHSGSNNIPTPFSVAVDTLGNAWEPDFENSTINKWNSSGVHQGGADGYALATFTNPLGLAVDAGNNVWMAEWGIGTIAKMSNDQSSLHSYGGGGLNLPGYVAIDGGDNVWVLDTYEKGITAFSNSGTALSPQTFGAGMSTPTALAIDGSGNAWATDQGNSIVVEYIGVATPVATPLAYGAAHSKLGTRP